MRDTPNHLIDPYRRTHLHKSRRCKQCKGKFMPEGSRETRCPWCKAAEFAARFVYWIMRGVKERQ